MANSILQNPWCQPDAKAYIKIQDISKIHEGYPTLNNLSLELYKGELFSILGPSGCGKTTLLRILAGFEQSMSGNIYIDGQNITNLQPYDRPVNMMFQSYALFPHMNVEENVAFGLQQEKLKKSIIDEKVHAMLKIVHMENFSKRKPSQLSGGQKQRVALARCLVKKPKLVLLDEPMAALDRQLREKTQFELVNIQEKLGITFVMVTHDQEEAMTMSTRIGIMEDGKIRQIGTPTEIYEYPHSRYVANFVGDNNIFEGVIKEVESDHVLIQSLEADCDIYVAQACNLAVGTNVAVSIRPEKIRLTSNKPDAKNYNFTQGIVKEIAYLGDVSIYHIKLNSGKKALVSVINSIRSYEQPITWDDIVYLFWHPNSSSVLAD